MRIRSVVFAAALGLALIACGGGSGDGKKDCQTSADCAAGELCDGGSCKSACEANCTGATPVCDAASRTCKACTTAAGCTGGTPFCDAAANGGLGACIGCRGTADCAAPSVCDAERQVCVGCTATQGCSGLTPICDSGTCVACTTIAGCSDEEFCDVSVPGGACVICTATEGCAEGQFCDLSITGGECVTCTPTAGCAANQICDLSVPGGACVTCSAYAGCDEGQFCDLSVEGGACVTCTADGAGCSGETPLCDTSIPGGACVGCLSENDCPGVAFCDPARKACVVCNDANQGCAAPTKVCDVAADDGRGACVECLASEQCVAPRAMCNVDTRTCAACLADTDCGGETPFCLAATGACGDCRSAADCGNLESCDAGTCRPTVSVQLQAVRDAPASASLALPVEQATVTYLRPAVATDTAGFFVQGERSGPAIFVSVDPATLSPVPKPGSRVSFTVTEKRTSGTVDVVWAITRWAVVGDAGEVGPFAQDVNAATDLVTGVEGYEFELLSLSGTITGPGVAVWGYATLPFTTAGMPGSNADLRLRMPVAVRDSLALATGCTFKLQGPMWREGTRALPTAYVAADLTEVVCP